MNRILVYVLISIFSIFLGSQITEGFLLVPYWKTLPANEFYEYYSLFGKTIGKFYSILTILAALIPTIVSVYCLYKKSKATNYAVLSFFFAVVFVGTFYIYFKGTNQEFYNASFNPQYLKTELQTWEFWHWGRVVAEVLSLIFLLQTFHLLTNQKVI